MRIRRTVLGDAHVDRSQEAVTPFTADFHDYLTRSAWGDVWTRPGLDLRTRSCITVAMLVALNRPEELALHIRGALNNGVTVDELREVLLQSAVYCGVPAANAAFRIASELVE
jgi:4-carboxymuconolactone decarboxylase